MQAQTSRAKAYMVLGLVLILTFWVTGFWMMTYSYSGTWKTDGTFIGDIYPYRTLGFALIIAGGGIGGMFMGYGVDKHKKLLHKKILNEVGQYFSKCPLCYAGFDLIRIEFNILRPINRPTVSCLKCGARWTAGFSYWTGKFRWAQLKRENIWGEGTQYLYAKYEPEVWRQLATAQPSRDLEKGFGHHPESQAQKYREYLQKLEEKHRLGEVSEEIYQKLKNEYLKKIEEMES